MDRGDRLFGAAGPVCSARTRHALGRFRLGLIGNRGSFAPVVFAPQVADFLGTVHHPYTFTVNDGVDAITDVIKHFETYDVTTIRVRALCLSGREYYSGSARIGGDNEMASIRQLHRKERQGLSLPFGCSATGKGTGLWQTGSGAGARLPPPPFQ